MYDRERDPQRRQIEDAQYEEKARIIEDCRRDARLRWEVIEELWHPEHAPERIDEILGRMLARSEPEAWAVEAIWKMLEEAADRMAAYRVATRD
jgi:hypothetical protein